MANYIKGTQRKQAMSQEYFEDITGMNRKQRKIAKRRANTLYAELGDTRGLKLAKNAKLKNKTFRIIQIKDLDYTPVHRSIAGGSVELFDNHYKYIKDRYFLDKLQQKRRKN
jgi:hypothetical protein